MKYKAGNGKVNQHKVTHNLSGHYLYHVWRQMMRRCYDTECEKYPMYGKRGIRVASEWHRVETFVSYIDNVLGMRPDKQSLDRIKSDEDYKPGNVKWSTSTEQARNTRTNRMITIDGITKCAAEWAEEYSIPYWTFHGRLRRGVIGNKLLVKVRKITKGG